MARAPQSKQLALDLGHSTSFALEDFIVTDANNIAFNHIMSFPHWPAPLTLITGPAKSGKSHLCGIWQNHADAYRPKFSVLDEVARTGGQTPVVMEDVDREKLDENTFFYFLNQSIRDKRPVLMTARYPIFSWPFTSDDLKSRARLATHFEVVAANDAELAQMFAKIFADRQIEVDPKVISFIVPRMERSPQEVVTLVALMDRIAFSRGRGITRAIAGEALAERDKAADQSEIIV